MKVAGRLQSLGGVAVCLLLAAACGGKVRSSVQVGEAGLQDGGAGEPDGGGMAPPSDAQVEAKVDAAMDAGVEACTELDHTSEAGLCQVAETCFRSSIPLRPAQPPAGVMVFSSQANLIAYFDNMAELDSLSVPAHGVDCAPGGNAPPCTYDPLSPALDPSDIHYSNPAQEFVGPDGHPYVWTYLADQNSWYVVDGGTSAVLYGAVADLNGDGCLQGG